MEVDSTFYAFPPRERFESWRDRTPDGFLFTLKMPGEVTHELGLSDPRLAHRFCDDARLLGPKLGPILVQLPPRHGPHRFDTTAAFLHALPNDVRFAIEFRDREWLTPRTMDLLAETNTTLTLGMGPWLDEPTARKLAGRVPGDRLYLRWLGAAHRGRSGAEAAADRDGQIDAWADVLPELGVSEVYAYFNNDYQGHSPASARRLQSRLGREPVSPRELSPQKELFG